MQIFGVLHSEAEKKIAVGDNREAGFGVCFSVVKRVFDFKRR
jgi:hypothetical protein